jgi:hypothetical protein
MCCFHRLRQARAPRRVRKNAKKFKLCKKKQNRLWRCTLPIPAAPLRALLSTLPRARPRRIHAPGPASKPAASLLISARPLPPWRAPPCGLRPLADAAAQGAEPPHQLQAKTSQGCAPRGTKRALQPLSADVRQRAPAVWQGWGLGASPGASPASGSLLFERRWRGVMFAGRAVLSWTGGGGGLAGVWATRNAAGRTRIRHWRVAGAVWPDSEANEEKPPPPTRDRGCDWSRADPWRRKEGAEGVPVFVHHLILAIPTLKIAPQSPHVLQSIPPGPCVPAHIMACWASRA